MIISVFGSPFFDPSGVRLDDNYDEHKKCPSLYPLVTRIIFGRYSILNDDYGHSSAPVSKSCIVDNCIKIEGHAAFEVAHAINEQLRRLK